MTALLIGAAVYAAALFVVIALCQAAGDADRRTPTPIPPRARQTKEKETQHVNR